MKKLAALCMGIFIWVACGAFASAASPLQELIDATPVNGVLNLTNQTYVGNLVITKPLTIRGTEKTLIKGDGQGNVITIKAPGIHLEHLSVSHSSFSRSADEEFAAIKIMSDHNVLKDLKVSDVYHGLYFLNSNENQISNVEVTSSEDMAIADKGNGIQLVHSNRNRLSNNVIKGTRDGIYFYYADQNRLEMNTIQNTRYGLHYMYADDNVFYRNRFISNTGGAAIMMSKNIELQQNEFSYSQGPQAFGLMLQESQNVQVTENHFFQNQRALYLDQTINDNIIGNEFNHNHIGAEIWASCDNLVFSENKFFHNTLPVISTANQRNIQWSIGQKGNDWGPDFPMMDVNKDGIGDEPVQYKSSLSKLLKDNELLYLFLSSPAISIYEKMGQMLNQQSVMFEDQHPIVSGTHLSLIDLIEWTSAAIVAALAIVIWIRRKGGCKAWNIFGKSGTNNQEEKGYGFH